MRGIQSHEIILTIALGTLLTNFVTGESMTLQATAMISLFIFVGMLFGRLITADLFEVPTGRNAPQLAMGR